MWVQSGGSIGQDKFESFEERMFRRRDRASLSELRIAIDGRRREFTG